MSNKRARNFFLSVISICYCIALMLSPQSIYAQDIIQADQDLAVKVFLDGSQRYEEYIKQEIPFVNYVRDRMQADVHIMVTTQRTGSNGTEHTITFTGLGSFTAKNDTLTVMTKQMDTEEQIRESLVNTLKFGLIQYVNKTPQAENIRISYFGGIRAQEEVVDKWNYWVFNINTNSRINGEETSKTTSLSGSLSADRVTPDWKISLSSSSNYNEREYERGDFNYKSSTRSHSFRSLVVKSVSDHWSIGGYGNWSKSSYNNINNSFTVAPAIEFNVFPYSESTFREFRFLYKAEYVNNDYVETTIYYKNSEDLFSQSLEATYEIKERWGSVRTSLEGAHYFHDFDKYHVELNCNFNIRLLEGLSLNLFGGVAKIEDQLSLQAADISNEELLTNQRALATSYDYNVSIGLRYTFGSIFSNVVNPRFGSSVSGGGRGGGGGFGGGGFDF